MRQREILAAGDAGGGLSRAAGTPDETGLVAADLFTEAVGQVAIAAGRDDTPPMLTGIRVEISGDKVVLAATDRFRLAVRAHLVDLGPDIDAAVLVPAKTLAEAAKSVTPGSDVHLALGTGDSVGEERLLACVAAAGAVPPACSTPSSRNTASCRPPNIRRSLPSPSRIWLSRSNGVALVADQGAQVRNGVQRRCGETVRGADSVGMAEKSLRWTSPVNR